MNRIDKKMIWYSMTIKLNYSDMDICRIQLPNEVRLRLEGRKEMDALYIAGLIKQYCKEYLCISKGFFGEMSVKTEFYRLVPEKLRYLEKQPGFVFVGQGSVPEIAFYVPFAEYVYFVPTDYVDTKVAKSSFLHSQRVMYELKSTYYGRACVKANRVFCIRKKGLKAIYDVLIAHHVTTEEILKREFFEPMYFVKEDYLSCYAEDFPCHCVRNYEQC